MRGLVEFVARGLVDDPGAVQVEETIAEGTTIVRLRVAPGDVGKVIGKHGRTAQALRVLLAARGARENRRAVLEILE
jgi:hypothetical protein